MGKIEDKYKPKSRLVLNFPLGSNSSPNNVEAPVSKIIRLTQEDYYDFSRVECWSICNFEALVFGEYLNDFVLGGLRVPPKKGTKQFKFLRLINDAVISGKLEMLVPEGCEQNPLHPLYKISTYNTYMVMADKAWLWAFSVEQNGFLKLPSGFVKMNREIMPLEFENHIGKMPAWDVSQYVRILFGERYQDPSQWAKNKTLGKFLDRIKAEIKVKKLQPLDPPPYSDIGTVGFLPIDFIEFWERYDNDLETLAWVKRLFLRIKEQERDPKKARPTNTEPDASNFLPAPSGTKWNEVGIRITKEGGVEIKIKDQRKGYSLEKFNALIPKKKPRDFLLSVIHARGIFDADKIEGPAKNNLKSYVSSLRTPLRDLFGISANPIESTGSGGYQTAFSVSSEINTSTAEEWPNPENNTPPEIERQIEANPPTDLLE